MLTEALWGMQKLSLILEKSRERKRQRADTVDPIPGPEPGAGLS